MTDTDTFAPDWTSPPGDTVARILEQRALSSKSLGERLGMTFPEFVRLLNGQKELTVETAKRLEENIGGHADFWLKRESQYRADLARLHQNSSQETTDHWLRSIPVGQLIKLGWIAPCRTASEQLTACLDFFGVTHPTEWYQMYGLMLRSAFFRTSATFTSHQGAISAWLRMGELKAIQTDCERWSPPLFAERLKVIRTLTRERFLYKALPVLKSECAACGVAVEVIRAPQGCRVSGATHFIAPDRAMLLLSGRYRSDDHFWFTFFHEAGHLILHDRQAVFLEGFDSEGELWTSQEKEANDFASHCLIPRDYEPDLLQLSAVPRDICWPLMPFFP